METTYLTKKEIQKLAPAVYAKCPEPDVTESYEFIPTYKILKYFEELGWKPVSAKQQLSRRESENLFGYHVLRFRNDNCVKVNGLFPELIWKNSHNRLCRAMTGLGFLREICENGLVVPHAGTLKETVNKKHIGFTYEEFKKEIEGKIINFNKHIKEIKAYKKIEMSKAEITSFATKAKELRWGEDSVIAPKMLSTPRRNEDKDLDLFSVFNVIQENLTKGGIEYEVNDKHRTTRSVESPYTVEKINMKLWLMMIDFYNKKSK